MPRWAFVIGLAIGAVLVSACDGHVGTSSQITAEESRVRAVLDRYLSSIGAADVALAAEVWAHDPTVEAVTPIGRFKGWDSVRNHLYIDFLQKMFSERRLTSNDVSIQVVGDTAWTVFDWSFAATRADGQPFASKGWESHVYRKMNGRWVIVQMHYSAPVQTQ